MNYITEEPSLRYSGGSCHHTKKSFCIHNNLIYSYLTTYFFPFLMYIPLRGSVC